MLHAGICAGGRPRGRFLPRSPPLSGESSWTQLGLQGLQYMDGGGGG